MSPVHLLSLSTFLPWFVVATCLELSVIFLLLFRRVSAAPCNAVFSFACLCFAGMIGSTECLVHPASAASGLLMYRVQLVSGIFAVNALLHFARLVTRPLPPRARSERRSFQTDAVTRLYAFAALIALTAWHPLVLHLPARPARVSDYDEAMAGPLFPFYIAVIFSIGLYTCGILVAALKRERHGGRPREQTANAKAEEPGDAAGYQAFAGQALWLLLSLGTVLLASVLEFAQAMNWYGDEYGFPVFPRTLAVLFFCFTTAWNLGRQITASERRKAEIALVAQTRLEAARHAQHQVKNALARIERPLHNILEQPPLPDDAPSRDALACEYLNRQRVVRAAAAIRELHHALDIALNMARVEVGEPLNIGMKASVALAAHFHALCRQGLGLDDAAPSGSVLRLAFQSELTVTQAYVYVDALREVFAVLLDNVCKYAPPDSLLTVRVWNRGETLCFCVADEGCGIAPEDLERIFELYRGRQTSVRVAGTGIGLTLAKRYIEAQGGRIWAESQGEGRGSAFFFQVPLEPDLSSC